jgi:outer membrane receptor protein involved in Fe transport
MSKKQTLLEDFPVFRPTPLALAISSVFAAPSGVVMAQDDTDPIDQELMLEEVTVTARKRSESLQMVPESIQAISDQTITQAGMKGMDDYVRFIPSMNIVQANPGTAMVVFRGIADAQSTFIAEPSAAVYLDEQSLVLNAQPNPRLVDIDHIEALSGPQGTLYGASAQSGVLRIITNKPDPTAFEANFDISLSDTKSGDISYDVSAMANIPISESFAVRLVGFTARDGGFIDIVQGTTPRFDLYTNDEAVQKNFNDVQYNGGRVSAKWFINDDWSATAGIVYQETDSDGRPEHDPVYAGDLAVVRFNPQFEYDRQDWTQYALTIEGDVGFADFVSATSYFTRDWEYTQDTSVGYASYFGTFCYNPYWISYSRYCFQAADLGDNAYGGAYYNDPIGYLKNTQTNSKFAQEFRLFHQGDVIDWVAGFFYEEAREEWTFTTFVDGYDQSLSMQNYLAGNMEWRGNPAPEVLPGDAWWLSYDKTKWKQWALFGEVTWHITDSVDATVGARWFNRTMDKTYWVELPRYNITQRQLPNGSWEDDISYPSSDENDWVPKFSLSWQINDASMIYGLYSEGFRPGGTNRDRGNPYFPNQYDSDKLKNFEIGTKNTFMDGRLRLNATWFDMKWNDYQLEVVDPSNRPCDSDTLPPGSPCGQPWQKVVANVGNASSTGLEMQIDFLATENFTIGGNATWLDAKLDEDVEIGIIVPAGSELPLSPSFKGSAYAQFDWPVDFLGADHAWLRLQWSYTGKMLNQVEPVTIDDGPAPQIEQPAYNIGDLRFGLDSANWSMQLYIDNLTDERAVLFANPYEFDYFFGRSRVSVNRPRSFGIRWIQRFGG